MFCSRGILRGAYEPFFFGFQERLQVMGSCDNKEMCVPWRFQNFLWKSALSLEFKRLWTSHTLSIPKIPAQIASSFGIITGKSPIYLKYSKDHRRKPRLFWNASVHTVMQGVKFHKKIV